MSKVLTREHQILLALARDSERDQLVARIRAQLRAWACEAAGLEPFPHGTIFDQLRAEVNAAHAEEHRDPRARSRIRPGPYKRKQIFERDRYTCQECGFNPTSANRDTLTIDHILPICEGGRNDAENLRTLCQRCNGAKGGSLEAVAELVA